MKRTLFLLLLTATSLAATAQTLQPWKLKLQAGQTYDVTDTQESNIDQQVMGQQMNISSDVVAQKVFSIQSAAAEGFRVEQTNTAMKMNSKAMGQTTTFDSSNSDDMAGPIGTQLKSVIGATMEAMIAPDGTINILKAIEMPEGFNFGPGLDNAAALAVYFVTPPAKPIQPGDTWTETLEQEGMHTQVTYTYRTSEKGQALLDYDMAVKINRTMTNNGMEIEANIQTEGKGNLVLELATGLVLERRYEGSLSGISKAMGMEIPQKGTQKTSTILTKR
jgi:hypothetical protein